LEAERTAKEVAPAVEQAQPQPAYELLVTKGTTQFTRQYTNAKACEEARQAIFAENQRMEDEAQAKVGTTNAAGGTIVAVGSPAKSSAACIPI
jgi:hypothetical protein